jgi:predicted metal-binding protein
MQDNLAGRILITKMEQREDNAAAAERFTVAQIEAAASGDKAVSAATAPQQLSAAMQDNLAGRILITKMEQREDNAAAAERFTVAHIEAAASGDKAVSAATAPQELSVAMQDNLAGRILIAGSSQQQQQQQVEGESAQVQERILLDESDFAAAFGKQLDASERIQHAAEGLIDVSKASHN